MSETVWRQNLITIEFTKTAAEQVTIQDTRVLTFDIMSRPDSRVVSSSLSRTRGGSTEIVDPPDYTLDPAAGTLRLNAGIVATGDSFALSYRYLSYLRIWTGDGQLTVNGKNYRGGGSALGVSEYENTSGDPDRRLQIRLSGIPSDLRARFLQDVGPLPVLVEWVYSPNRGTSWSKVPISFRGRLSSPSMSGGVISVELETQRGDVDRGQSLRWSHEDQQRRFTGDLGLEHMRALSRQGVETSWPP